MKDKKLPQEYFNKKMRDDYKRNPEKYRERARLWRKNNKEAYRAIQEKTKQRHLIKYQCRQELYAYLKMKLREGEHLKPTHCACGAKGVQAHHHDYSKPLDVVWLCVTCHSKTHHPNE